jgi:hypothetical protein
MLRFCAGNYRKVTYLTRAKLAYLCLSHSLHKLVKVFELQQAANSVVEGMVEGEGKERERERETGNVIHNLK